MVREVYSAEHDLGSALLSHVNTPSAPIKLSAEFLRVESQQTVVTEYGEISTKPVVIRRHDNAIVENILFYPEESSTATIADSGDNLDAPRLKYSDYVATLIGGYVIRDEKRLHADLRYEGSTTHASLIITVLEGL